jgi:hypothetical protein
VKRYLTPTPPHGTTRSSVWGWVPQLAARYIFQVLQIDCPTDLARNMGSIFGMRHIDRPMVPLWTPNHSALLEANIAGRQFCCFASLLAAAPAASLSRFGVQLFVNLLALNEVFAAVWDAIAAARQAQRVQTIILRHDRLSRWVAELGRGKAAE